MHILFNHQRLRLIGLSFVCVVLQGCSTLEDWTQTARQSLSPHTSTRGTALINGKDLNAWKLVGNANWRLQDGLVQAELGDAIAFDAPQGGMFFWARLTGANGKEANASAFAKRAIDKLVAFVPGAPFYAHDPDMTTLRLSFATADVAKIEEGIARLGQAL